MKKLSPKKIKDLKKKAGLSFETSPLLEIRPRLGLEKHAMTGATTELLLDGVPVRGATGVRFEVNAKGIARATITLIGRFKVTGRPLTKIVKLYK